jgi:hypothetical protein
MVVQEEFILTYLCSGKVQLCLRSLQTSGMRRTCLNLLNWTELPSCGEQQI